MQHALNQNIQRRPLKNPLACLVAVMFAAQVLVTLIPFSFNQNHHLQASSTLLNGAYLYNNQEPNSLFGNFYLTLGAQLAARGQIEAAEKMLGKAAHLLPNDPEVRLSYATVLESSGKEVEAMAEYQEILRIDPDNAQTLYSLGLLEDRMGRIDKGLSLLHSAVLLDPQNFLIHYDLGVLYAKKEDFKNSAIYSKNALEHTSNFAEAYNNYGYALAQLGRYSEALEAVDKSLLLKPDSAAALDSKGFALFGLGCYEEALTAYKQALKEDPSIGEVYLHIAQTYEKLEQTKQSIAAYETYLEMTAKEEGKNRKKIRLKLDQLRQQFFKKSS